jgi:hypothetical protein
MKLLNCCSVGTDDEGENLSVRALENLKFQNQFKEGSLTLQIFPLGSNKFIGKVQVDNNIFKSCSIPSRYSTVVILDCSGSMGPWVRKITQKVLPAVFSKLGYSKDSKITILAFDNICEEKEYIVSGLTKCSLYARGGTCMHPAVLKLKSYLKNIKTDGVRIIALSDGGIYDKVETKSAADALNLEFKGKLRINSQAVQIFSSNYANPDTIALCSLLQMNNTKSSQMANIFEMNSFEEQVNEIVNLVKDDGLDYTLELDANGKSVFKKDLWANDYTQKISLKRGDNIFWLDPKLVEDIKSSENYFKVSGKPVSVVFESKMEGVEEVSGLIGSQIKHVFEYLKVLRIINSDISHEVMSNILQMYRELEAQLTFKDDDIVPFEALASSDFSSRMVYLRHEMRKRNVGFSMKMAQIVNDNTIDSLNSAQKAQYLRSTSHSKTSRGLAKRAAVDGLNFDEIAREEALEMAKYLDELTDVVNDSKHQCSFYSMETTLGGIKAVADLTRESNFDEYSANDILLLLNVVGVACEGPVGDFPDPMTWRVNRIYPGVFVSVSDLMTSKLQSRSTESNLAVPGYQDSIITSAIPVFEDERIAKFLRKHAPHLLSYTCSIGMRGMIAHVVMTDGYTLCAGIWKLVEHVVNNPTELTLKTFDHLVKSYDLFSGEYFMNSRNCLVAEPDDPSLSFYLQNNGLTNMISPIYNQCSSTHGYNLMKQNIPAINRALYSYECWQVFRREVKGADSNAKISKMLNELLGINVDKYGVKLPELFLKEPIYSDLKFHDEANFNYEYLNTFINSKGWYLKYVLVTIKLLKHVADGTLDQIKGPLTLSEILKDEKFIKAQLGLPNDYDLKEYLMYSAVQSLLFPKMNDRVDQENGKMKIEDLIKPETLKIMIKDYIINEYKRHYDSQRVLRLKQENSVLLKMFLDKISICTDHQELIRLFKEGVTEGEKRFTYKGFSSFGYVELRQRVLDTSKPIYLRKEIMKIFLLACDVENGCETLFNDGKTAALSNIEQFKDIFMNNCGGSAVEWDLIFAEYKIRSIHTYRATKPNRHGHCNDKPSYWAIGYITLEAYANDHTKEEFEEYCKIHYNCCGVNHLIKN